MQTVEQTLTELDWVGCDAGGHQCVDPSSAACTQPGNFACGGFTSCDVCGAPGQFSNGPCKEDFAESVSYFEFGFWQTLRRLQGGEL